MHVAMYAPALPSTGVANGIVTYARIMQAALTEAGHRCTVLSARGIEHADGRVETMEEDGRWTRRLSRSAARRLRLDATRRPLEFLHVLEAVRRVAPIDILEMEESFGWVGRIQPRYAVVARLHGPHFLGKDEIEDEQTAALSTRRIVAEGAALNRVTGLTCPSARLLAETLSHYAVQPRRAAWIPNPMPVAPPGQRWSIDSCTPNQLLFVGRFDQRKGADVAIEAFAMVAAQRPDLTLVMCGPDPGLPLPDGQLAHFERYVAERLAPDVRARVRFLGPVSPDEVARLRLQSALCVSTSRFEVLAYSLAEGLAVGAPILASDTFGMAELLRDGIDGFIAPIGDAAAVAQAIERALADPQRLAAVGAAGLALCEARLAPARIAEQTLDFYRTLG